MVAPVRTLPKLPEGKNRRSSYLIQAASKCQAATIELQGQDDI